MPYYLHLTIEQCLGIDSSRVLTMRLTLPLGKYPKPEPRTILFQRLHERLRGVSAIQASAVTSNLPMVGGAYELTILVELLGGILLLVGFRPRVIALVLAAWCVATAFTAHYHRGDTAQMIHFMKNLCMAGGFLQIAAFGAGRIALTRN